MRLQLSPPSWWSNFLFDALRAWNAGMANVGGGTELLERVTNLGERGRDVTDRASTYALRDSPTNVLAHITLIRKLIVSQTKPLKLRFFRQ